MNRFFFWLNWPLGYRLLYSVSFLVLLGFLSLLGYYFWLGDAATIQWYTEGNLEIVKVILDRFSKNFFDFTVDADTYLLTEEYKASTFQINHLSYYFQLAGLIFGSILILTSISDMPLAWYAGGLTFIVFLIAVMSLEMHQVSNELDDKALPLILMAIFVGVSFLFKSVFNGVSYFLRFLVYSAIMAGIVWYVAENSKLQYPAMQVSSYSIVMPILMLGIFSLLHGHEIVRSIAFIVTNGTGSAKGRNFRFISLALFYILNLIYAFAHLNYRYDLDIYYLHPAPLLIVTTLLGIWGFQKREESHYGNLFAFAPTGAFMYLGMAIIAVSTYAFSIGNGNDSLREMSEDLVLYGHIGIGLGFFGYVYFNFRTLIAAGKKAHRVIYKPLNVDFSWAWLFGVMVVVGLMVGNGFFIFDQGFAAYFTGQADLEWAEGDTYHAKQKYNLVFQYDRKSHHANYALASIAQEENDKIAAYIFLKQAQEVDYRPYDYAQMAALKSSPGEYIHALFDLKAGIRQFPKSAELLNNLALQFNKRSALGDSSYIYFDLARKYAKNPEVIESNLFSLWTKYDIYNNLDSVYAEWKPKKYIGTKSNELAFLNKVGKLTDDPFDKTFLPDSVLSTPQLCYLYNYAINQTQQADDSLINILKETISVTENLQFDKYLYFVLGNLLYSKGNYQDAFDYLKAAQRAASLYNAYFPNLIGLRMMQHDEYLQAADYFKDASQKGNEDALMNKAIALSELTDKSDAITTWKLITQVGQAHQRNEAHNMLRFLVKDSLPSLNLDVKSTDDLTRLKYLHYNHKLLSDADFDRYYHSLTNPDMKVMASAERTHFYLDQGNVEKATRYIQLLTQEKISDEANSTFQLAYLRFVHAQGNLDDDFYQKVSTADFPFGKAGLRDFYQAEYHAVRKNFEDAEKLYLSAMQKLPFNQQVRVQLNQLYKQHEQAEKGYLMLVEQISKNPNGVELLKAYAMTCLELGYTDYAKDGLDILSDLLDETSFVDFEKLYQQKLAKIEESLGEWNE